MLVIQVPDPELSGAKFYLPISFFFTCRVRKFTEIKDTQITDIIMVCVIVLHEIQC